MTKKDDNIYFLHIIDSIAKIDFYLEDVDKKYSTKTHLFKMVSFDNSKLLGKLSKTIFHS